MIGCLLPSDQRPAIPRATRPRSGPPRPHPYSPSPADPGTGPMHDDGSCLQKKKIPSADPCRRGPLAGPRYPRPIVTPGEGGILCGLSLFFELKSRRRAWVQCRGQRERVSWGGVGVGRRGTLRGRVARGMAGRWSEGRRQPIIHRPGVGAFVESSLLSGGVRWDQRRKQTKDGALEVPDAGFGRACPQTVPQGLMQ